MSNEQFFEQMIQELRESFSAMEAGIPINQGSIPSSLHLDSYLALLNELLATSVALQRQSEEIYTVTYNQNFGDCTFELQTTRGRWITYSIPPEYSESILDLLGRFVPQKLISLGTEHNPYVLLEPHHVRQFLAICQTQFNKLVGKFLSNK